MDYLKINMIVVVMLPATVGFSQSRDSIPLVRKTVHADINKIQQTILKTLNSEDSVYALASNKRIDDLQNSIEKNSSIDGAKKIMFLKGLYEVLNDFQYYYKIKELKKEQLPILIDAFSAAMNLEIKDSSILPVIK